MAEEKINVTSRAEAAGENILRAQASGQKLRAVGLWEIEVHIARGRLMARGHHVEPLQGIGFIASARLIEVFGRIGELCGEFCDELRAHLVATPADRRAECGQEIGWFAAKFEAHAAHGFFCDARERALPARMNGSDGAFLGINKEDRDAIGRLHGKEQAGAIRGGCVALAWVCGRGVKKVYRVRVNLLERREGKFLSAERGLQKEAILCDIFARVPFHEAEIEDGLAIKNADAAGARAETVDKPRKFVECRELEDLQAAGTAHGPRRGKPQRARHIAFAV